MMTPILLKTSNLTREKYMKATNLAARFRGLLPVVIDIETSGLNPATDGLLEIAAVMLTVNEFGRLTRGKTVSHHVEPFVGARIDQEALEITGIDPDSPLRFAIPEAQALHRIFAAVQEQLAAEQCYRAVLVGHNAWFDLSFILAAAKRARISFNVRDAHSAIYDAEKTAELFCHIVNKIAELPRK